MVSNGTPGGVLPDEVLLLCTPPGPHLWVIYSLKDAVKSHIAPIDVSLKIEHIPGSGVTRIRHYQATAAGR